MKVLFCIRSDYYRNFAGDSMQVIKKAEYLRKMGVKVDINNGEINDYSDYDIVHLFNLTTMGETYKYYRIAKSYKKIIVLSPLYWNLKKYLKYINDYEGAKLWDKCRPYRYEILNGCKMIYTNSKMEGELLKKEFKKDFSYTVIYNGVEIENDEVPLYNFKERYKLNSYILCVGKICKIKNQLMLSKICNRLGLDLVLIGNINDKDYFNECIKYPNVTHLGFMDSYNIYNAYRFAKLHILPSFIETPGLSSLEAGASGCNIISTEEGSAKEYFKDMVIYCNPYYEESIESAIKMSLNKNKNDVLKKYVTTNYNWEKSVKSLYNSYINLLKA
ncbi:glycosyltransferase involved in cell wall biosynthesis [Clostridium tetanomorphum]|uniref:glycosyltransferase family 4 protein n=1 Tax=Clostridium tetanomorphum TaxID=1553 RepID=UPI0004527465|nr:glycosyltransferase [Clostridium tetanomorphum]KAJ50760.1 group 1 glycosyl transferase [Clostridium tetanomorphum DSM 665]MBP1866558.1 glycosyltransferase involved in cell wall biosynthesis [Clostridium tetanomorphum]NRS85819.1 glycosyltransferase involved in cell wall biosynthesis [Clostridium tetanomorphum]SQC02448.1 group 1 glycosyl transferase [Clostridium tetanomorphum]